VKKANAGRLTEKHRNVANAALYTNGKFVTCSGFGLNGLSKTVTCGNFWFYPPAPVVLDCNGGRAKTLRTSQSTRPRCWCNRLMRAHGLHHRSSIAPGSFYRVGVAETMALRFGILRDVPQHGSQLAYKQRQQIRVHPRDSNASWMSARFS